MRKQWVNLSILFASLCVCLSPSAANAIPFKKVSLVFGGDFGMVSSDLPDMALQGDSGASTNPSVKPDGANQDLHPRGWGVHAGLEFPQTPHFSIGGEGDYQNFGEFEYKLYNNEAAQSVVGPVAKRTIRVHNWAALLTMRYQWIHGINLFAKVGPAWVKTKVKQNNIVSFRNPGVSDTLYNVNESFYNIEPEVVLGVGFRYRHYINVYTSYTHINGSSASGYDSGQDDILSQVSRAPEINMVSIGASIII